MENDRLLTTGEAARLFGIARNTLASYARSGVLRPAVRLPSGQYRWRASEIRAQLDELERQAGEDRDPDGS